MEGYGEQIVEASTLPINAQALGAYVEVPLHFMRQAYSHVFLYRYQALAGFVILVAILFANRKVSGRFAVPTTLGLLCTFVAPWAVKRPAPYLLSCEYWETYEPYVVIGGAVLAFALIKLIVAKYVTTAG